MLAIADVNAIHPIGSLFAYVNADSHFFRLAFTSASNIYFFYSTAELFSGVMKGKGKTFMAMIISIFSACVIRIFWIAFIDTMNNHSILLILACYPISWFVSILLYTTFDRVPQKEKIQD